MVAVKEIIGYLGGAIVVTKTSIKKLFHNGICG